MTYTALRQPLLAMGMLCALHLTAQPTIAPTKVFDLEPYGATHPLSIALGGTANDVICYTAFTRVHENGPVTYAIWSTKGTSAPIKVFESQKDMFIEAIDGNVVYYWSGSGPDNYRFSYGAANLNPATPPQPVTPVLEFAVQNILAQKFEAQVLNGKLICAMDEGPNVGVELVSIPALTRPKSMIKEIHPGAAWGCVSNGNGSAALFGGKVFFNGRTPLAGSELWATDGTAAGTLQFSNFTAADRPDFYIDKMKANGSKLFLSASNGNSDMELWTCTTQSGSLTKLKDIWPGTAHGSYPSSFTTLGANVFFIADDGTNGRELWVSDGTAAGTRMVKDLCSGAGQGSMPNGLTAFNGMLYFFAKNSAGVSGLYRTDGTVAGTVLCYTATSPGSGTFVTSGRLYYRNGGGLWCTDGTAAGLRQVVPTDGATNADPFTSDSMVARGNALYFIANYYGTGYSLWKVNDPHPVPPVLQK